MAWKHDNVFLGCDAHYPKYWEPNVKHFINSRGQDKVLWGSNSLDWGTYFDHLLEGGYREGPLRKLLRDNAIRLYRLDE